MNTHTRFNAKIHVGLLLCCSMRFPADIFLIFTILNYVSAVVGNAKDEACDTYVIQPSNWSCKPDDPTYFVETSQNANPPNRSRTNLSFESAMYFRGLPVPQNSRRTFRLCVIAPFGYIASISITSETNVSVSSSPKETFQTGNNSCSYPKITIWAKNVLENKSSRKVSSFRKARTRRVSSKEQNKKHKTKRRDHPRTKGNPRRMVNEIHRLAENRLMDVTPTAGTTLSRNHTAPDHTHDRFKNEFIRQRRLRSVSSEDNSTWVKLHTLCEGEIPQPHGSETTILRKTQHDDTSPEQQEAARLQLERANKPLKSLLVVDINADFKDQYHLLKLKNLRFFITFDKISNGTKYTGDVATVLQGASGPGHVLVPHTDPDVGLNRAITLVKSDERGRMSFLPEHMVTIIVGSSLFILVSLALGALFAWKRRQRQRINNNTQQELEENQSQKPVKKFCKLTCCCCVFNDQSDTMSVASDRRVNNNHRPLKIREIPYKSPPPSFVLCSCCRAPPNNHVTRNIASQSPFIASGCRASGLNHPGTSSGQHNATPKNFIKYNRVSNNPYRHDTYPPHVRYPSAPTLAEPENGTESPGSVRSYASRRLPRTDQLLTPRSSCVKPPPNRTHLRSDNIVIERMGVMKPPRCPLHSSKDDSKHDDSVHVSKSGDTCACESRNKRPNTGSRTWEPLIIPAFDPNYSVRDGRRPQQRMYGDSPPEYSEPPGYYT